jgi:hypothetical protein
VRTQLVEPDKSVNYFQSYEQPSDLLDVLRFDLERQDIIVFNSQYPMRLL